MKKKFFSIDAWLLRFSFAFRGLVIFLRTEHNSRIYLVSTITVTVISILKGVSKSEAVSLVVVIGFVWISELFNTAVEKLADMITLKYDGQIKIIKDLAAGAVLLSALVALITGMLIFIPKFY